MDFGTYIFEQTIKHAKIDAIRFPIDFLTLLYSIILDQHPNIKITSDVPKKREPVPIMFQTLLEHLEVYQLQEQ